MSEVAVISQLICLILFLICLFYVLWRASNKKFRYDYREEWMRFSSLLFDAQEKGFISTRIIKALAHMVHSPQGVLFEWEDKRGYVLKDCWNGSFPPKEMIIEECALTEYLRQAQRAIELSHFTDFSTVMKQFPWAWLLVPLLQGHRLHGFVLLAHPQQEKVNINWEVLDLLSMSGQQAVVCLVQEQNALALSVARQFEGVNRLSAFVVHDLKNVLSQLKLIENNREKHQNNPLFIKSVYQTIEQVTEKIDRLLLQMRTRQELMTLKAIDVAPLMRKVIELTDHRQPIPQLDWQVTVPEIIVMGDDDRFVNILCHLVENAQQATPENGEVVLSVKLKESKVMIDIQDSGCGMDPEYIHAHLYKPFSTTKGEKGTGIGVYEAREYIHALGGRLTVASERGVGSIFSLEIPLLQYQKSI